MADAVNSCIGCAHNFVDSCGVNEISNCKKCSEYESQLREALNELSSLKLVNKLLQKEVLAYTTHKSTGETDCFSNDRIGDPMEHNGWTLVTSKSRTDKLRLRIKDTIAKFHQPIQMANRYTPLNEVLTNSEGTTAVNANGVIRRNTKKKKVIVIGTSQARGLAAELSASH